MNATSSRAHTVVQIRFTQKELNADKSVKKNLTSNINLIDLAGSERSSSTGATGDRLAEGNAINQSLSALGLVIKALADKAAGKAAKNAVVPYRSSKLTYILKPFLGGNAKTAMVAALSPASVNYDETLGTLRYAFQVKAIKNAAVVNESP
jgi:kinesin family protein 1